MARYKIDSKTGKTLVYDDRKGKWVPDTSRASKWDFARSFQVMSDISEFQSPIDGAWITSRSQLREHERKHGVRQVGNDLKGKIIPETNKRQRKGMPLPDGVKIEWN